MHTQTALAALDVDTVKTVGVIGIGVLILLAVAFAFLIQKVIVRLAAIVIVLSLAAAIYVQRDNLADCPQTCSCSFFGLKLQIPDNDLAAKCKDVVSMADPVSLRP